MTHSWGFAPRSACGTRPARTIPDSIVLLSACTITNTLPEINPASGILTLSAAPPVKTVRRRLGCRDENVMGILQEEHAPPLSGEGTAEDAARRIQSHMSLYMTERYDCRPIRDAAIPVPNGNRLLHGFLLVCTTHALTGRCSGDPVSVPPTPAASHDVSVKPPRV